MPNSTQNLFASPICTVDWTDIEEEAGHLGLQLMKKYFDDLKTPASELFKQRILTTAKDYAIRSGQTSGYLYLSKVWCRIIKNPSYFVPPHVHANCWAVGTFYFTDGQGDLVLFDPRGYHKFEINEIIDAEGQAHSNCTDYYYTPQALHAIFFPAYLKHMVLPTGKEDRARMAMSWNLEWWPKMLRDVDPSRIIEIQNANTTELLQD